MNILLVPVKSARERETGDADFRVVEGTQKKPGLSLAATSPGFYDRLVGNNGRGMTKKLFLSRIDVAKKAVS